MKYLKASLFLLALIPLERLIWLATNDALGANPIEFVTRSTGTWALVFLCITLTMTPLRLITGSGSWIRLRRMLGLFSFFYGTLHFSIWLWLDQNFDLAGMLKDVIHRPFIAMGFVSFVMLTILAITSNHWAQKRLGRRWVVLHRMVYLIAVTVILHYWWHKAGKNDFQTVSIYALILLLLLACRVPIIKSLLQRSQALR